MKPVILIVFLILALGGISQKPDSMKKESFEYYNKKSSSQKTAAWIFVAGGTTLMISGVIVASNQAVNELVNLFEPNPPEKQSAADEILFFTGLAGVITSVPFFISSAKNRKKAEMFRTSFRIQSITYPGLVTGSKKYYPSLALSVRL
jgi:hypothetical protein